MANLADVLSSSRELSLDRFVTPTFFITGKYSGLFLTITDTYLSIWDKSNSDPAKHAEVVHVSFITYPTLDSLLGILISAYSSIIGISYSASFVANDSCSTLIPIQSVPITSETALCRRNFFSDAKIMEILTLYFVNALSMDGTEVSNYTAADFDTQIKLFEAQRPKHCALYCAYWLVDNRRMYESAAQALGQTTFSLSGQQGVLGASNVDSDVSIHVGDVFTLNSSRQDGKNTGEEPWRVGADNVLGDANSFWYKLQLWLRSQFERLFGDYSLRPDTVMVGSIDLQKDINFYAYYDSYPYTISPLSREILSSFEKLF